MAVSGEDVRSDEALLEQIAVGDRAAIEVLYRRHVSWLLVRLSRRCSGPDLVDQAVQDTFVAVQELLALVAELYAELARLRKEVSTLRAMRSM